MKIRAVIACGSNLLDPERQLECAMRNVAGIKDTRLIAVSRYHRTEPEGFRDQPAFLNGAFLVETDLTARELFRELRTIEERQGRTRLEPGGPRSIDLDLIFFGDAVIHEEDLRVPHPRAHLRDFVLRPVCEIAPDFRHPELNKTVKELFGK